MSLNSNTWYAIASASSKGVRSLHWCGDQIICNSDSLLTSVNASWQIVAQDAQTTSAASYILRNRGLGPGSALRVSLGMYDGQPETQPGFAPLEARDPTQQWDLVRKGQVSGDNIYFVQSIANGSNYNLAEHADAEGVYMALGAQAPSVSVGNQTWVITKLDDINNATWTTSTNSTTTASASPSLSSSASPSPSFTSNTNTPGANTSHPTEKHELPGGVIAAVVIGAVLGVLFIVLVIILRLRSRRQNTATRTSKFPFNGVASPAWSVVAELNPGDHAREKASTGPAVEMPSKWSERSFERTELPEHGRSVGWGSTVPELDATTTS